MQSFHPAIGEEFLRRVAAAPEGAVVIHDVPDGRQVAGVPARISDQGKTG